MGKHHKPLTEAELRQKVKEEFAKQSSDPADRAELLGNAVQRARETREALRAQADKDKS